MWKRRCLNKFIPRRNSPPRKLLVGWAETWHPFPWEKPEYSAKTAYENLQSGLPKFFHDLPFRKLKRWNRRMSSMLRSAMQVFKGWVGWKSCLKKSWESISYVMKPLNQQSLLTSRVTSGPRNFDCKEVARTLCPEMLQLVCSKGQLVSSWSWTTGQGMCNHSVVEGIDWEYAA